MVSNLRVTVRLKTHMYIDNSVSNHTDLLHLVLLRVIFQQSRLLREKGVFLYGLLGLYIDNIMICLA